NFRLDRQQRQDAPLRDVHRKPLLVEHGGAARQLVGDEGDERRDIAVEIEHLFDLRIPARRREPHIARLSVPAHGLPKSSAPSDIETPHTALQEQTAGGPRCPRQKRPPAAAQPLTCRISFSPRSRSSSSPIPSRRTKSCARPARWSISTNTASMAWRGTSR